MTILTDKQLDKFYDMVMEALGHDNNVTDFYFDNGERITNKFEKLGFLAIVPEHEAGENRFRFNGETEYKKAILTESGLNYALEIFGNIYTQKKDRNFIRNSCPKCNGNGRIKEYGHVQGGICFECNGTGRNK